jgi:ubiquitin-conjugating enzyme E2 O
MMAFSSLMLNFLLLILLSPQLVFKLWPFSINAPPHLIKKFMLMLLQVVHYHAGGLRLNPNLYDCGKVCLSLLGTWPGSSCEKWNSAQSTMLQVLISIQALVLNEMPYFNEPGCERYTNSPEGLKAALDYNDTAFQYSCRTMLYSLRRPPQVMFC